MVGQGLEIAVDAELLGMFRLFIHFERSSSFIQVRLRTDTLAYPYVPNSQ